MRKNTKGEATREKIIAAARRVFIRHPFHAASIRMIGTEGGFDFSLIHHYFTKTELFEAVAKELYEEFMAGYESWLEGMETMKTREGLTTFIDRATDYCLKNPDAPLMLMQNIASPEDPESHPGLAWFIRYFDGIKERLQQRILPHAPDDEVGIWVYGFTIVFINSIGAARYHGTALGLDHQGDEYREWIKATLIMLFLPPMRQLIRGESPSQPAP